MFRKYRDGAGLGQVLLDAYSRHGGQVIDNEKLTPHATSYEPRSSAHSPGIPNAFFLQTDPTTTGTLFANIRGELGHLNVPLVGSMNADPDIAKAAGASDFSKWATPRLVPIPAAPGRIFSSRLSR